MQIRWLLLAVMLMLAVAAMAQTTYTIENLPNPKDNGSGYVSDPDGILNAQDRSTLNALCSELEQNSTAQVAIVIVNSIGQENPKDFTTRLFNHWGIGQADVDNGLLVFSVMDQRRTEFETGYGLEGVLPDVICYRIGMQELVPYFREGDYGAGLIAATQRIRETLENPETIEEIRSSGQPRQMIDGVPDGLVWYAVIDALFVLFLIIWLIYTNYSKQELYDRFMMVRKVHSWIFILLFPLPYALFYPLLSRHLKKLRNQPRYGRKTGAIMHKLHEVEDDRYLELGQVVEEHLGSVDYDVWITEDEEDILILPYKKRWSKYKACPKCQFRTYALSDTNVLRNATYSHSGKKEVIHTCKNCNYRNRRIVVIPKKTRSSGGGGSFGGGGGSSFGGGSSGGGGAGVSW
ncbi:TPM domain-containing protein [Phaeodactylibacter xiamenensis]|uniref:TPM domain-containing protein n=1 Tax=Phaeodactylibacter xiamenensis TaxID=1524460 RepID=UPI0024A7C376|nr:TPM domain-containing protein [Phaeodactylibacter xiamenensis]